MRVSDWFQQCGPVDGVALGIYNAFNILVAESRFIDCCNRRPDSACIFFGRGQSNGVVIRGNDFDSGQEHIAPIRRSANHLLKSRVSIEPGNIAILGPIDGR